jgi:hypothetical protein
MGLLWGAVTLMTTAAGPLAAAVVFAGVAVGAAGQSCMAWHAAATARSRRPSSRHPGPRHHDPLWSDDPGFSPGRRTKATVVDGSASSREAFRPVAVGGAVLMALAGGSGPVAVAAATAITGVASLVVGRTRLGGRQYDALLTASIALTVGASAAVVPVVRAELGFTAAVVLLLSVHAYEASAFLIGAGSRHRWEGAVAGAASVAALALAAAAVLVPPFRGASAWVLGAVAIALTSAGRRAASAVLPTTDAFAPALRRLDGFLLTGPVWAVIAAALLDVR